MKILQAPSPNYWPGGNRVKVIVIHWWGTPASNPTLSGVINHLCNPASQVSAHYVVSGDNVMQLIQESDRAWHAQAANHFSIGIEVDPNAPGNTYATVAELVRDIRTRHGNIPLKRHSDYVATACPGGIDLGKIEQLTQGEPMYQGKSTEAWAATAKQAEKELDALRKSVTAPAPYWVARKYAQQILLRDMGEDEWRKYHSGSNRDKLFDDMSGSDERKRKEAEIAALQQQGSSVAAAKLTKIKEIIG